MKTEEEMMKLPCPLFSIASMIALLGDVVNGGADEESRQFATVGCLCRGSGCPWWDTDERRTEIKELRPTKQGGYMTAPEKHEYELIKWGSCGIKH